MFAVARVARPLTVAPMMAQRSIMTQSAAPAEALKLSSMRRASKEDSNTADPHTSVFRSQQRLEVRTLKSKDESTADAVAKPLDRFGFKNIKDQLKNYVAGPLYAH